MPQIQKRIRPYLRPSNSSWGVDGIYVWVKGRWMYLYRAVDSRGREEEVLPQGADAAAYAEPPHAGAPDVLSAPLPHAPLRKGLPHGRDRRCPLPEPVARSRPAQTQLQRAKEAKLSFAIRCCPGMRWCGLILKMKRSLVQASQMAWNEILHRSASRCLTKL